MTFVEISRKLESMLKPSRYEHVLGVVETAVFLANRFGVDIEKARLAALLHDAGRAYKHSELLPEAVRRNLQFSEIERDNPVLLHAAIGADMLADFGITDPAIIQAVKYHTVGGEKMTRLDKIIYFADMIEPNRAYHGVKELRKLAHKATLDEMVFEGIRQSIIFVAEKKTLLHPSTIAAYNDLVRTLRTD